MANRSEPSEREPLPWLLAALAFVLALVAGQNSASAQGAPAPAVTVTPVASREVHETADFVGRVTPIDKVDIVARVPGFVEERLFTEGQFVKAGDLLFRIEQDTYKAAVEQQTANLAKAKAVEVNASVELTRAKALVKSQLSVSQETVDQRSAAEGSAQADVLQAQAALEQAQINLRYTEIHAPIAGRIGLANFTVGNLVGPSTGTLATIVSQDPIYVIFQASERDVLEYKRRIAELGDANGHVAVRVRLPDGSLYPQPGVSNFLDIQVTGSSDTVAVRAQFPNPQGLLTPGGVVGVEVEAAKPQMSLVIPQSAIALDQAGSYVLVVDPSKKVEQRRVTTGTDQGTGVAVTSGLKEGELVIVEGMQKVRPGQTVAATVAPGN